jgi:putative two-component system response regulator
MSARVLLAEDSPTQALRTRLTLEQLGFEAICAADGVEALERARRERPDAILSDILMPSLDGFQLCLEARRDPSLHHTAIVLYTASFHSEGDRAFGAKVGADAFIEKDCDPAILEAALTDAIRKRAEQPVVPGAELDERAFRGQYGERLVSRLVEEATEREHANEALAAAYNATLEALVGALDLRDTETELHSWRVTAYARTLAERLEVDVASMIELERGSMLHDIGKIGVPDQILRKPGPLDEDEWAEMQKHPRLGYNTLAEIDFLSGAKDIVLAHHERWDGGGYPRGLSGDAIPLGALIFAVADTLDAITSDRPYREGRPFDVALGELERMEGSQFDPRVVQVALRIPPDEWQGHKDMVHDKRRGKRLSSA